MEKKLKYSEITSSAYLLEPEENPSLTELSYTFDEHKTGRPFCVLVSRRQFARLKVDQADALWRFTKFWEVNSFRLGNMQVCAV